MKIEFLKINDVVPADYNPRKLSDKQRDDIKSSLLKFGFVDPVIINRNPDRMNVVVGGHQRLKVWGSMGNDTFPAVFVDLPLEKEKELNVRLNKNTGEWDFDVLLSEFDACDLDDWGFEDSDFPEVEVLPPDETTGDDEAGGKSSLSDRFLIPPFSVLNAREGWWQDRKSSWLGLGIKSEVGRGSDKPTKKGDIGGVLMKSWTSHPKFYPQKVLKEKELGRELTTAEFIEKHFIPPTDDAYSSGTSIFDPVLCEIAYRWFSPPGGLILDPFAGGSVRGIVASKLGRQYIGHELRDEQVLANREQALDICADNEHHPAWIIGDSRGIDKTCADVDADFVFSCPPYADLEVYSDDPNDLSTLGYIEFRDAYFEIIKKSCARLKANRFACFVVGEVRDKNGNYYNFVGDTVSAFMAAGLNFYNEAILVTCVGSLPIRAGKQFSAGRKMGKTHQNILVFVKGDGKKAAQACGDVEVDESMFEGLEGVPGDEG